MQGDDLFWLEPEFIEHGIGVLAKRGRPVARRLGVRDSDTGWPTSILPVSFLDALGDAEMLDLRVGEHLVDR